jgi:hypothetical protein
MIGKFEVGFMNLVPFNWVDGWRGVVRRNVEHLQRIAHLFFFPWEKYALYYDADGLGVWVAVSSTWRPEALLKAIQQKTFPTFGLLGMRFDGQQYWTHFRAL